MRLVVYATSILEQLVLKEGMDKFDIEVRIPTEKSFKDDVEWFNICKNGILILHIKSAATGWRAPAGTIILFTGTIKDGPEKTQAQYRAKRDANDNGSR